MGGGQSPNFTILQHSLIYQQQTLKVPIIKYNIMTEDVQSNAPTDDHLHKKKKITMMITIVTATIIRGEKGNTEVTHLSRLANTKSFKTQRSQENY